MSVRLLTGSGEESLDTGVEEAGNEERDLTLRDDVDLSTKMRTERHCSRCDDDGDN